MVPFLASYFRPFLLTRRRRRSCPRGRDSRRQRNDPGANRDRAERGNKSFHRKNAHLGFDTAGWPGTGKTGKGEKVRRELGFSVFGISDWGFTLVLLPRANMRSLHRIAREAGDVKEGMGKIP